MRTREITFSCQIRMHSGYKIQQEHEFTYNKGRISHDQSDYVNPSFAEEKATAQPSFEDETAALYPAIRRKPVKIVNSPPPDGGLTAWLQVLGSFFLFFASWGLINSFGVFQAYYETTLLTSSSSSQISWIGSIQACLLLSSGLVVGPFFDRGYLRSIILIGLTFTTFGMMITSISTKYWQLLLVQGFCVGLGSGCLFVPSIAILATYFSKKKAAATGIALSGGSLGGVILPIMFQRLLPRIGFGWTTRAMTFLLLGGALISLAVMRIRALPKKPRAFLELGAFKEPIYTLVSLSFLPSFAGLYIPSFYIEIYGYRHAGVSLHLASYLLAILNGSSIFGRIIPNIIADSKGYLNTIVPCTFISAILGFSWLAVHDTPGVVAFCVIFGFFSGSVVSLNGPVIVSVTEDLSTIGTRTGMSCAIGAIGVLIGNPIAGSMINITTDKFKGGQIFCGAITLLSAVLLLAARIVLYNKNKAIIG